VKGVILAGGLGTGFRPLSYTTPKQLVPIANKPLLYYIIEDIVSAGIGELGIVVGSNEEVAGAIKDAVGDGSRWGCKISYIRQDTPKGLAHAVGICREFVVQDRFVVYLGDNMLRDGISSFVSEFNRIGCDASLLVAEVDEPGKFGIAVLDKNGNVVEVEEKPKKPKSNLAITGIYLLTPEIFPMIDIIKPSARGELEITDAIGELVKSPKHRVNVQKVTGWWDTGSIKAALNVNSIILNDLPLEVLGEIEEGAKVTGRIGIGKGTRVMRGAVVEGPSIIGEDCLIEASTHIGSHTSIGDRCSIKGSRIESSIIYHDVKIDFKGRIADSIIGEFSEISGSDLVPEANRLIVGARSRLELPESE
jgi:glucose-1-phosphate thymidylyltransferase